MWKKIGKIISLCFFIVLLWAGELEINADVDKKNVPINESLQLTIVVDGSVELPGVSLPVLDDFEVIGQSSATQIQVVNGQRSNSRSFIFTLRPKKQGPAQIPAMSFTYKDKTYKTNPLDITVIAYTTPNAQSKHVAVSSFDDDIFQNNFFGSQPRHVEEQQVWTELVPAKNYLYVGEKTILDFKLYFERGFYQGPAIGMPKFPGLVVHDLGESQKQIDYHGKKVNLYSLQKEIYALRPGSLSVEPVQVQYISSPFGGVRSLATKPLILTVRKLPSPQPEKFSGAIGSFELKVNFQPTGKIQTGTAIPLLVTITGQGNLDMVNELNFDLPQGLTAYFDGLDTKETKGLTAKRVYKYFITAGHIGEYKIPALQFCFFDPRQGQYRTVNSTIQELNVREEAALSQKLTGDPINALEIESGEINIRLNKTLTKTMVSVLKNIIILLFVLACFGLTGFYLYKNLFSPVNLLHKKFDRVKDHPDTSHFLEQMHQLFFKLVKLKDKIKLQGLPINEIEGSVSSAERAQLISLLARKFEELKYTNTRQLTSEDRIFIIDNIFKLF